MAVSLIWEVDAGSPAAPISSQQKVGFNQVKGKEDREMAFTSFPSVGAFGHRSRRRSPDTEVAEPVRPPARPHSGSVRVLRTPEELSEAISRAQEFEQHKAELMWSRSQRYRNALSVPDGQADRPIAPTAATAERSDGDGSGAPDRDLPD
jgi:hypothetical protein